MRIVSTIRGLESLIIAEIKFKGIPRFSNEIGVDCFKKILESYCIKASRQKGNEKRRNFD